MINAQTVKTKALQLGFTSVGIAAAAPLGTEAHRLAEWLRRGYHAGMHWMARNAGTRVDPCRILPGAQSVISVALNYYTPHSHATDAGVGRISRYAWGDDYHDILTAKLKQLMLWVQDEYPGTAARSYVDTGPVMEKAWAQRAGIGWIGKHGNVITTTHGSWVFLGELITTLELEPDLPATDHCGTCTRCLEACPTHAIVEPYVVDSNLCISYLTIEHRGDIAPQVARRLENWIYGCDICQDVCPWNRKFAVDTSEKGFHPREGNCAPHLVEWNEMSQEEFSARFRRSPIKRTRRDGLRRNVRVALGMDGGGGDEETSHNQ